MKIHWLTTEPKNAKGEANGIGERNGNLYVIARQADGRFQATHFSPDWVMTPLRQGVSGHLAWRACVDHHNAHYCSA